MSSAGSWEVVGKTKKDKPSSKPVTKEQIKQFVDNMPKIQHHDPLDYSQTKFDVFIPKEKQVEEPPKANGDTKKAAPAKKKKSDQDKKESKPKSVEGVLSKLDSSELQHVFNKTSGSFPENPDVWLKDMASFLNMKLEHVIESETVFKDKPGDFPLCKMSKGCQEVINNSLKKVSNDVLEHIFYHCVQCILLEPQKGLSTYGYRIFVQALVFYKPNLVLSKFSQYLELLKSHQNRPLRCLSILWCLGQPGVKKLQNGLKVWLDLMMPALGYRSVAPYCVEYLEELFRWHSDLESASGSLSMRDYFKILDIIFSSSSNMQADLKKRLQAQYPKLKTLAFGEDPSSNLRNFFPSFLSRVTPSCAQQLKRELLSNLVTCLQTDPKCFSTWCQMYTKHLPQSGVLLGHISSNWDKLSSVFDKKVLKETLRSFSVTNDQTAAQGQSFPDGHSKCASLCKDLLRKMGRKPFPWFTIILSIIVVLVGIVAYDIFSSRSFKGSRFMKFLDSYGVLVVLDNTWNTIQSFLTQVASWLSINVPLAYNYVSTRIGPCLTSALRKSADFILWTIDASRPYRQYVMTKIVQGFEWVHALNPDFWAKLWSNVWLSWGFLKDYALLLWKHILHAVGIAYTWLLQNVLVVEFTPENVHRTISWSLSTVQNYTQLFLGWCSHMVSGK